MTGRQEPTRAEWPGGGEGGGGGRGPRRSAPSLHWCAPHETGAPRYERAALHAAATLGRHCHGLVSAVAHDATPRAQPSVGSAPAWAHLPAPSLIVPASACKPCAAETARRRAGSGGWNVEHRCNTSEWALLY